MTDITRDEVDALIELDNAPWTYERRSQTILDKDGHYVAMIRGWGKLTGRGSTALGLSEEDAIKIQDDRGVRLAKVPEYEARIKALETALRALSEERERLLEALRACDSHHRRVPALTAEQSRENIMWCSLAKTLTRAVLNAGAVGLNGAAAVQADLDEYAKETAKRERDDKRGLNDRSDEYNGQGTCDEALKRMERKAERGPV